MIFIGPLITALAGGLAVWFAQFVTRKVAIALAYVTTLGTITLALLTVLWTVVSPLANGLFQSDWFGWVGLAFPPIAADCILAYGTVWSACVLYSWQRESLRIAASV